MLWTVAAMGDHLECVVLSQKKKKKLKQKVFSVVFCNVVNMGRCGETHCVGFLMQ